MSRILARTAAVTVTAAAALAAPAIASADTLIDIQPTALLCPSGIAGVQGVTHADNAKDVKPGEIFYVVNEQGKAGPNVNWVNIDTWQTGATRFEPVLLPGIATVPAALIEPGGGTVLSAVWGNYENAAGENCFLLPGIDIAQLQSAPGD